MAWRVSLAARIPARILPPWKNVWERMKLALYVFGWLNSCPTAVARAFSQACEYVEFSRSCGRALDRAVPDLRVGDLGLSSAQTDFV